MATILEPESESSLNSSVGSQTASTRLRENFSACRLKFKWLGTSKTLSADQKSQAAEAFDADSASISAGKRLIDVVPPGRIFEPRRLFTSATNSEIDHPGSQQRWNRVDPHNL